MKPAARFPFVNLSTELVLLILSFAARPAFAQSEVERNPYASALALCQVSRVIRRAALAQLLRTVILSTDNKVTSFVHALRMQHTYRQLGHHLYFDYTAHVRRIWIGQFCVPPPTAPLHGRFPPNTPVHNTVVPDIDFSVLAPVILGACSLAIDFSSLFLLCGCLEHAWSTHRSHTIHPEYYLPPWRVKYLTLSGEFARWLPLKSTAEGSAFLASISHLIILSPTPLMVCRHDPCFDKVQCLDHSLPEWITSVPWAAFNSIQAVSLPFPHIVLPSSMRELANVRVALLTLCASAGLRDWAPKDISGSIKSGQGHVSLVDVRPSCSRSSVVSSDTRFAWEEAWACGLCK